jgi:hypothetical protein
MANVICPMCGHLVYAPDGKEYVVCTECNYVIYVPNETHDRETETET